MLAFIIIIAILLLFVFLWFVSRSQKVIAEEDSTPIEIERLSSELGAYTNAFYEENMHVFIFEQSKKIAVYYYNPKKIRMYDYQDIVSCELNSKEETHHHTIKGKTETRYTTSTSGKSLVGRALAGAVVAGPLGAMVGGMTAKKQTISEKITTPDEHIVSTSTTYSVVVKTRKDTIPYYSSEQEKAARFKEVFDNILNMKNIM